MERGNNMTEREKAIARQRAIQVRNYERNRIPELILILLAISYFM